MTTSFEQLDDLRHRVDEVNLKIIEALNLRKALIIEIIKAKQEHRVSIFDPEREEAQVMMVKSRNPGPMLDEEVEEIFETILRQSKSIRG